MRAHSIRAICLALTLAGAAGAQTYTVKVKQNPDPGKSAVNTDKETRGGTVKVVAADGKVLTDRTLESTKEETYTEVVLEKGAKAPRKYTRAYEKAGVTAGGKTAPRSFQGRTLLFEQKGGKYVVTAEDKSALDPRDATELAGLAEERANELDEVILPQKPVKIGEKWTIDVKALAVGYARIGELDAAKTTGEGVLTRVYEKDGHQFGVLEVRLKLAVKTSQGLKFDPPAVMEAKFTLDAAIDGSGTAATLTMTGTMTGKGVGEGMGMKYIVDMNTTMNVKQVRTGEK